MARRYLTVLVLVLAPLLGGCEAIFPPRACTLIGCADGITVRLAEPPQGDFTLELLLPGGEVLMRECSAAAPGPNCGSDVFFPGVTPEEATVRVTTPAGTRSERFRPTYAEHQPNGRGCPPVCRQATVEVAPPR